jgi:hypothetical protein
MIIKFNYKDTEQITQRALVINPAQAQRTLASCLKGIEYKKSEKVMKIVLKV